MCLAAPHRLEPDNVQRPTWRPVFGNVAPITAMVRGIATTAGNNQEVRKKSILGLKDLNGGFVDNFVSYFTSPLLGYIRGVQVKGSYYWSYGPYMRPLQLPPVYALGLYASQQGMERRLRDFRGRERASLLADQKLYDTLAASTDVERTLRIVVTWGGMTKERFCGALEERLKPAMQKGNELDVLEKFKAQFDPQWFSKGLEVAFVAKPGGLVVTKVNDSTVGELQSKLLANGIFDVYLGSQPPSADTKAKVGRGLVDLIERLR